MDVRRPLATVVAFVFAFATGCTHPVRTAEPPQVTSAPTGLQPTAAPTSGTASLIRLSPRPPARGLVPTVPGVTDAAPGYEHLCVINEGAVWCVGRNQHGQLGHGHDTDSMALLHTGITDAAAVSSGPLHTCAIRTDRTVWCWGYGATNSDQDASAPSPMVGVARARQIAAGEAGSCVVTFEGRAMCWGDPALTGGRDGPNDIDLPIAVTQVSVGPRHACALGIDDSVWCWGINDFGQLGDATVGGVRAPARVTGIESATGVAAGGVHGSSCAVLTDRTVRCWGEGTDGQLGDGRPISTGRPTPGPVPGITAAVSVSLGAFHGCVTTADGEVWCWGRSAYLGSSAASPRGVGVSPAVPVTGVEAATVVRTQRASSCAVLRDDTIMCWGTNSVGQLGNGASTGGETPVAVVGMP